MSAYEIFRLIVWVIGVPVIVYLVWRIVLRVREIDRRIAEVRAEEEEIARNPYAAYARMLEVERLLEEARGGRKRDKPGGIDK